MSVPAGRTDPAGPASRPTAAQRLSELAELAELSELSELAADEVDEVDGGGGGRAGRSAFDLAAAVRAGTRRRRRRTRAVVAGALVALVAVAGVRHATTDPPPAAPPASATPTGHLPGDARHLQDAVQDAVSAVAPQLAALDWRAARTDVQRVEARRSGAGPGRQVLVDLARYAGFAGRGPVAARGPVTGVGYRATTPLLARFPVDPCVATGAHAVPLGPDGRPRIPCTRHTGLDGGPGGSADVPGASGVVGLREWQQVVGTSVRGGSGIGSVVETVRQAVLTSGGTTWSLAASAVGDGGAGTGTGTGTAGAAGGAQPALRLDQLELGVRYLATASLQGGPGVQTARLLSRAVVAGQLGAISPGVLAPDWSSPRAQSAGNAPFRAGRAVPLDLRETAPVGEATFGYRVVRADGAGPDDVCAAAGVVSTVPRDRAGCTTTRRRDGSWLAVQERRVGGLDERQVTVLVRMPSGAGRWASAAVTAPGARAPAPLPLSVAQLTGIAQALATTDPP